MCAVSMAAVACVLSVLQHWQYTNQAFCTASQRRCRHKCCGSLPGEGLVAGLPVEQDLALLGQGNVAGQAEVQLHRRDQVGVAPADGSLKGVLSVLVVHHLGHTDGCLTAVQAAHCSQPRLSETGLW